MWQRIRESGNLDGTATGDSRPFPLSCANRTWGPWVLWYISPAAFGEKRITYDNVTRGFWKIKKAGGQLPANEFFSIVKRVESTGYSDWITSTVSPLICSGPAIEARTEYRGQYWSAYVAYFKLHQVSLVGLNGPEGAALIRETLTECLANRQKGDTNLVESLAELDKAWHMAGNPLENVNKFLRDFTRASSYKRLQKMRRSLGVVGPVSGKYYHQTGPSAQIVPSKFRSKKGKAFLTLLSSEWLRFRYGIMPLVNDVRSGIKACSEVYDIGPKLYTARASKTLFKQQVMSSSLINGPFEYFYTTAQTFTYSIRAVWTDSYRATPWTKLGITFHNVVGVPWELTHFSFVVDWFANVGDVIYANIPRVGVEPVSHSYFAKSVTYTVVACNYVRAVNPATARADGAPSDIVVSTTTEKRRYIDFNDTGFVIKSDFRLTNYNRAADAIALIQQQLGRIQF
jgi:hypothetical protein